MKTKLQLFSNIGLVILLAIIVISKLQNVDRARLTPTRSTASIAELGDLIPINKIRRYIKGEDEVLISTETDSLIEASWRDYKRRKWHFSAELTKDQKWQLKIVSPALSKYEKNSLELVRNEITQQSDVQIISITSP